MKHELLEALIDLSNIFKEGFTVTLNNGEFNQYSNTDKPYIVSYKTLIEIDRNTNYPFKVKYHKINDLKLEKCIIGAWLNLENGIYYIELNKTFKDKNAALLFAIKHKQLAIYDMNNQKVIEV